MEVEEKKNVENKECSLKKEKGAYFSKAGMRRRRERRRVKHVYKKNIENKKSTQRRISFRFLQDKHAG